MGACDAGGDDGGGASEGFGGGGCAQPVDDCLGGGAQGCVDCFGAGSGRFGACEWVLVGLGSFLFGKEVLTSHCGGIALGDDSLCARRDCSFLGGSSMRVVYGAAGKTLFVQSISDVLEALSCGNDGRRCDRGCRSTSRRGCDSRLVGDCRHVVDDRRRFEYVGDGLVCGGYGLGLGTRRGRQPADASCHSRLDNDYGRWTIGTGGGSSGGGYFCNRLGAQKGTTVDRWALGEGRSHQKWQDCQDLDDALHDGRKNEDKSLMRKIGDCCRLELRYKSRRTTIYTPHVEHLDHRLDMERCQPRLMEASHIRVNKRPDSMFCTPRLKASGSSLSNIAFWLFRATAFLAWRWPQDLVKDFPASRQQSMNPSKARSGLQRMISVDAGYRAKQ